jgi:hydrogenase maturation protease
LSGHTGKILVIGYGNPGRRDDGLGPAFADAVEKLSLPGIKVECNYQLSVEDAHEVASHDFVVFADASAEGQEPFSFEYVEPMARVSFSTHSLAPSAVVALARELFGAETNAYLLGVRGYIFDEFGESLTPKAASNLSAAVGFFSSLIRKGSFRQTVKEMGQSANYPARRENERSQIHNPLY